MNKKRAKVIREEAIAVVARSKGGRHTPYWRRLYRRGKRQWVREGKIDWSSLVVGLDREPL